MARKRRTKKGPPRKRNNACVETWIDREILATLGSYFYKQIPPPRSMSELVRMGLTELADILVQNKLAIKVDDPVEATQALERMKVEAINRSGRGLSTYLKLQQVKELGIGDPYLTLRTKAEASEATLDAQAYEGMIQYWMSTGLTEDEAKKKIDPSYAPDEEWEEIEKAASAEFDEQAAIDKSQRRDQEEKDALARGPGQATIMEEEPK